MSRRAPLSRPGLAAGLALLLAAPVVLTAARAGTQPLVPGAKPDPIETFRLARIPYAAARGLYKDSPEFLAALAQQLAARRALLVLAPDYEHVVERLLTGEADAAWLGTLAFAEARARGIPLTPLVCPVRKTGKTYTGLIITHRDNNLSKLSQLGGKRFGFVDHDSASGYLFPRLMLEEAGVAVPAALKTAHPGEPDFLGNHANVVLNVLLRKVDAGAIYEGAVEECFGADAERSSKIRILARTEPIPGEPVVVLASTPPEQKRRIRDAFLRLFHGQPLKFEDVLDFATVQESDYDYVQKLVSKAPPAGK